MINDDDDDDDVLSISRAEDLWEMKITIDIIFTILFMHTLWRYQKEYEKTYFVIISLK